MTFLFELDPSPKYEKPCDKLCHDSMENWNRIATDVRQQIVEHVRSLASVAQLNQWRDQYTRAVRIGSDDPWFHMGVGMQIRNACRKILLDDALPGVKYPDGNEYQNWDDFYGGMLQQLASEVTP